MLMSFSFLFRLFFLGAVGRYCVSVRLFAFKRLFFNYYDILDEKTGFERCGLWEGVHIV